MIECIINLGMVDINIVAIYDQVNRCLMFTFSDSLLIINEHIRNNLSKLFELDLNPVIESQYIESIDSKEF